MEEQLEKELRFHLEEHMADLIARGHLRPKRGGWPGRDRRPGAGEGGLSRCPRHALD